MDLFERAGIAFLAVLLVTVVVVSVAAVYPYQLFRAVCEWLMRLDPSHPGDNVFVRALNGTYKTLGA